MLLGIMIINKNVNRKVLKEYFFIKGFIDIDSEYFIEQIKKSCSSEQNMNFKSSIRGLMTPYNFFNKDPKFTEILLPLIDYVDSQYDFPDYRLQDAWGFEVRPRDKTTFHDHHEAVWSGVIYLNDCEQSLDFPEIKEELKPKKGVFAVFSPFLKHGCEKNQDKVSKFGLSFNIAKV